jgi:protein involved in polysaccharide export with SLBB domain
MPGLFLAVLALAQCGAAPEPPSTNQAVVVSGTPTTYVLSPNDMVLVKVYQEVDLETSMRIARDGTATFPLIGAIQIGGKTVDQAARLIRDLLDKDFLVNPQVTLTVMEYAKRRFTVLGQVQKPGAFEIPNEESITLLEAIAMAGGYSRLANPSRITVTRSIGDRKISINVDGKTQAKGNTAPIEIRPDDTITVDERIF